MTPGATEGVIVKPKGSAPAGMMAECCAVNSTARALEWGVSVEDSVGTERERGGGGLTRSGIQAGIGS